MGQRTRQGRAKTGGEPISRAAYRDRADVRDAIADRDTMLAIRRGEISHDNAGGRARFAAKHAAQPHVKYERTEQSAYSGPKTSPVKPSVAPRTFQAFRKVGEEQGPDGKTRPIWRLIAAILGR